MYFNYEALTKQTAMAHIKQKTDRPFLGNFIDLFKQYAKKNIHDYMHKPKQEKFCEKGIHKSFC